jgi:hypothetical protein
MRALLLALATAAVAAAPASAATTTFGADLDALPANNARTCAYGFLGQTEIDYLNYAISMGYPNPYAGQLKPSCTWWTGGNFAGSIGAIVPFGGGTVKRVRVKAGAITGPMQVIVIRELREGNSLALNGCCFATTAASPVFTPTPNGVTELAVDMPVRHDLDTRTNVNTIDTLGLSVLAADVPVPAWVGGTGYDGGIIAGLFPHYEPGTERLQGYGSVTPGQVLIQADLEPAVKTVEEDDGEPPLPPVNNPVTLARTTFSPKKDRLVLPLSCGDILADLNCIGSVLVQSRGAGAATAAATSPAKTYAKGRMVLLPGSSGTTRAKLTKAGRKALKAKRRVRAFVNVVLEDESVASSTKITIRR